MSLNRSSQISHRDSQTAVDADLKYSAAYVAQMMLKAGAGCGASFATVYRLTRNQVFTMILRINRDRNEAEDVLQETYLSAWTRAHWFDQNKGEVLAWLATIARHRAIDSLRHKKHRPQFQWHADDQIGGDVYAQELSPSLGPLELTAQRSDARLITEHLVGLPAMQRQSVVLAFYEGLSHPEIAMRMGKPLGSVKSWVRRGLAGLKNGFSAT